MKEVLKLAKKPIEDKKIIHRVLDTLGKWLIKEFKSIITDKN